MAKRDANTLAKQIPDPAQDGAVKRQKKDVAQREDELDSVDDQALLAAAEEVELAASNLGSSQPESVAASSSAATPASLAPKATTILKQSTLFPSNPSSTCSQPSSYQPHSDPSTDPVHLERTTMSSKWYTLLLPEFSKPYFTTLKSFLSTQNPKTTYPPSHLIYNWSRLVPSPSHVRVVVVGQDPYHGPNQACGLSFSVAKGVPTPPSLKNIYKELAAEYPGFKAPNHGCLDGWAKQGVLLLNACLTVSAGQAGSHHGKGWEVLTKRVLKMIADDAADSGAAKEANRRAVKGSKIASMFATLQDKTNSSSGEEKKKKKEKKEQGGEGQGEGQGTQNKGVVFLIWGAPAAKTLAEAGVTGKNANVLILKSPHPSPLSAHRGFLGNGHFKKANEWLKQRYGEEGMIDWSRL
ncbi:hypothetical protein NDA11_000365 [Ustilago hordei]|nr:hypothetical protein NDA11_000365 [Ustilago hordei]